MKKMVLAAAMTVVATSAYAGEPPKGAERPPVPAFEKLKSLVGDWTMVGGDDHIAANWRVTAHGSAVVETLFPGAPHEMVTVYTLHGKEVHLTHYCAAGNQPEMNSDKAADDKKIVFTFSGGVGINPKKDMHMHNASFTFTGADSLREEWGTFTDGKAGEPKVFELKRVVTVAPAPAAK